MFIKRTLKSKVCFFLWLLFAHLALVKLADNLWWKLYFWKPPWDEGHGGKKSIWLKKGLLIFKCRSQWMKGKPAATAEIISNVSFHSDLETAIWQDCQVNKAKYWEWYASAQKQIILWRFCFLIEGATDLQRRMKGPGREGAAGGAAWCWREDHLVALQLGVQLMKH